MDAVQPLVSACSERHRRLVSQRHAPLFLVHGTRFAERTQEGIRIPQCHECKQVLRDAGLRDGRLHDARHTAATVLLILQVHERAAMGVMGWATTSMAARYQHMTDPIRADIAKRVGGLIWKPAEMPAADPAGERDGGSEAA
ncbi:hypothetical protein Adi01nite_68440 [Amorphoplanes digitatis]|nr:hypothetical protein Adi01nite_68440 [Actinoplanes digitatis]